MQLDETVGVIFDCDGTLIDSMDEWRWLERNLANLAGVELTPEQSDALTPMTIPEVGEYLHGEFGVGASGADVVERIYARMHDFYGTRAQARPGALECVKELAALGVHMVVASSTPNALLQVGLKHCGFAPYLEAIISVDDVGASKREPVIFAHACNVMGIEPCNAWGVEDSAYAIETLKLAGCHTVGIYDCDEAGTKELLRATSDIFIESFEDDLVARLSAW